jgi:hypothetical protein
MEILEPSFSILIIPLDFMIDLVIKSPNPSPVVSLYHD